MRETVAGDLGREDGWMVSPWARRFASSRRAAVLAAISSDLFAWKPSQSNLSRRKPIMWSAEAEKLSFTCPRSPPRPLSTGFFGSDQSTIFKRDNPLLLLNFPGVPNKNTCFQGKNGAAWTDHQLYLVGMHCFLELAESY